MIVMAAWPKGSSGLILGLSNEQARKMSSICQETLCLGLKTFLHFIFSGEASVPKQTETGQEGMGGGNDRK